MYHCRGKKKTLHTSFHSSSENYTKTKQKNSIRRKNEMKLEDSYLEEKVLNTVGIGLAYKSIQENLNQKKITNIQRWTTFWISLDWHTWRLCTEAEEGPFDSAARVNEL